MLYGMVSDGPEVLAMDPPKSPSVWPATGGAVTFRPLARCEVTVTCLVSLAPDVRLRSPKAIGPEVLSTQPPPMRALTCNVADSVTGKPAVLASASAAPTIAFTANFYM